MSRTCSSTPVKGSVHSWEPSRSAPNNYWQNHDRLASTCDSPACYPYFVSPGAGQPDAYSYHQTLPHTLAAPNKYWENPEHYQRYPGIGSVQKGIAGANYIYNSPSGAYSLNRGSCIISVGNETSCFDETTANSCIGGHPFFSGLKCSDALKLYHGQKARSLAQGPGAPDLPAYKPWDTQNELYDNLLDSWKYNRPGYNE